MHMLTHVLTCMCAHTRLHVYTRHSAHMPTHACMCTYTLAHSSTHIHTCTHMHIYTCLCTHAWTNMHTYIMHAHVDTCTLICRHMCMHMCAHAHICTHTHTCSHVHTRAHARIQSPTFLSLTPTATRGPQSTMPGCDILLAVQQTYTLKKNPGDPHTIANLLFWHVRALSYQLPHSITIA